MARTHESSISKKTKKNPRTSTNLWLSLGLSMDLGRRKRQLEMDWVSDDWCGQ